MGKVNFHGYITSRFYPTSTGVNPAGDTRDASPNILVGGHQWEYLPNIIMYFRNTADQC